MRIIGYLDHPTLKITVFKMDNRISVKFETGFFEQTYKFPQDIHLQTLEDVKGLVNAEFTEAVRQEFDRMHKISIRALSNRPNPANDNFEEII